MKVWRDRKRKVSDGFQNVKNDGPFSFTQEELDLLTAGKCPFCLTADSFMPGPEGGLSINLYCSVCHAGINVLRGMNMVEKIRGPEDKWDVRDIVP